MKVRLKKNVRSFEGNELFAGTIVDCSVAQDGCLSVNGVGWLDLNPDEWEPLSDDLKRLLGEEVSDDGSGGSASRAGRGGL